MISTLVIGASGFVVSELVYQLKLRTTDILEMYEMKLRDFVTYSARKSEPEQLKLAYRDIE
jgi:predicted DNA-binding protein YlxM (UPF0122 family)